MARVKRHRDLSFEIKAGLLLLVLLAAPVFLASGNFTAYAYRALLLFAAQPLEFGGRDAMDLALGPDGALWALDKRGVHRFGEADPDQGETLLGSRDFTRYFGHPHQALSALHVAGEQEAWVGGWHGDILHYRNGEWREVAPRDEPIASRIHDLVWHRDRLFIAAGDGLWFIDPDHGRVVRDERFGEAGSGALLVTEKGELLFANGSGIHRWFQSDAVGQWLPFWFGQPGQVRGFTPGQGRTLLLASSRGLFVIEEDGTLAGRYLSDHKLYAAAPLGEGWLTSAWGDGVGLIRGDGEAKVGAFGLPADRLSDLAVVGDQVWLAGYGSGLYRIPLAWLRNAAGAG